MLVHECLPLCCSSLSACILAYSRARFVCAFSRNLLAALGPHHGPITTIPHSPSQGRERPHDTDEDEQVAQWLRARRVGSLEDHGAVLPVPHPMQEQASTEAASPWLSFEAVCCSGEGVDLDVVRGRAKPRHLLAGLGTATPAPAPWQTVAGVRAPRLRPSCDPATEGEGRGSHHSHLPRWGHGAPCSSPVWCVETAIDAAGSVDRAACDPIDDSAMSRLFRDAASSQAARLPLQRNALGPWLMHAGGLPRRSTPTLGVQRGGACPSAPVGGAEARRCGQRVAPRAISISPCDALYTKIIMKTHSVSQHGRPDLNFVDSGAKYVVQILKTAEQSFRGAARRTFLCNTFDHIALILLHTSRQPEAEQRAVSTPRSPTAVRRSQACEGADHRPDAGSTDTKGHRPYKSHKRGAT